MEPEPERMKYARSERRFTVGRAGCVPSSVPWTRLKVRALARSRMKNAPSMRRGRERETDFFIRISGMLPFFRERKRSLRVRVRFEEFLARGPELEGGGVHGDVARGEARGDVVDRIGELGVSLEHLGLAPAQVALVLRDRGLAHSHLRRGLLLREAVLDELLRDHRARAGEDFLRADVEKIFHGHRLLVELFSSRGGKSP